MVEEQRNREQVDINISGTTNVVIRLRCVGDMDQDRIFLDDMMAIGE